MICFSDDHEKWNCPRCSDYYDGFCVGLNCPYYHFVHRGIEMHPYKKDARSNDPKWMGGLKQYVKEPVAEKKDTDATIRNHSGNKKILKQATYEGK